MKRKYIVLLVVCVVLLFLDQITKQLIVNHFNLSQSLPVIHNFFNITLVHNPGAAFGLLANLPENLREPFFLVMPLLTLLVILYVYHRLTAHQGYSAFSLSMIMGGAIGNLVDRVRLGFVIDFLDFHWSDIYHFPAFNVADSAITVGVTLLMVSILFEKEQEE